MQTIARLVICLLLWAAGCSSMHADGLASYARRVWQAPDGLPEQTVQAFAQTPDGYLWIGTTGGLVRFDGAHFTVFDRQNTPALHENSIFCLMVAHDAALWIGTEGGGLARYAHGQFRSWTTHEGLSNDFVRKIVEDARGAIWTGTDNGLLRLDADRFVRVDGTLSIPALAVHGLYIDRAGRLWAGGSKLLCIENGRAREYTLPGEASQNRVKSILQTADGTIWVGTVSGLNRMLPGHTSFDRVAGVGGTVRVLLQDASGVLWIGTIGQGVFEWSAGVLTQITAPSSLPSNTILNFFEDSEKNFWIGTQTGMVRLRRSAVSIVPLPKANDSDFGTIYQDRDGSFWIGSTLLFQMKGQTITPQTLPGAGNAHVRNIYRTHSGALWVGTDGDGLYCINTGHVVHLTTRDGLSNNFIRAMVQDHDGSMWIAADEGINHVIEEGERLRIASYQMRDGLAYFSTRALLEDRGGDLWIGTDRGLSHMHHGVFVHDAATDALAETKIWAIHEDADGGIWFGTRNNGLYRYRDGKLAHYSAADGLAGNAIYQILEDKSGHLWTSGPNGISLLNRHELDAQAESFPRHFSLTFYSTTDIAANTEIYGGTQPSGCITQEGDAWFPSNLGPIHISPSLHALQPPPPLHMESLLADGLAIPLNAAIVLRPSVSRLQFSYAPIQLSSQGGLRFRYRLDDFDKGWSTATTARTADYTNLPAGHYLFSVQAFEIGAPDAVSETSLPLVKRPFFYRTWWFLSMCILFLALLTYGMYQYRVRQVRARFESVLDERSRLAREMHDTVIQGCTGVSALLEAVSMDGSNPEKSTGLMDFARLQLRKTIDEAREAIWNLRNSDADGLGDKLESIAHQAGREFSLSIDCSILGTPFSVSHPVAHDLLMVAREGIFNAALHGHPAHIDVTLTYKNRELSLSLSDDGCGFDTQTMETQNGHHFGLRGMRERMERSGGEFQLISAPGKGVKIEVRLPRRP